MHFHRTQPVHALVVVASVGGLGAPPGSTPNEHISSPETIRRKPLRSEQYCQYRSACYWLAFTAKSLQETAGILGPLGSPVKLTCDIALSLVQALDGMTTNRQVCTEIADLVTEYLNTIREELDEAAKEDVKFRTLVGRYAETLREVSRGVALIRNRHRLSRLVYHQSEFEELLGFKAKLDAAFQALMLQCNLQTRQILGHVVTDLRRMVDNQHSHMMAAFYERLEGVHEKLDHIVEYRGITSDLEQILQPLAA